MSKLIQIFSSRRTWAWPYVAFMAMFVVLPLILVGVYAFTDIHGHFTLHNFAKFFTHSEAIQTFLYSLMIAVFNTAICLLIGYPAAYIMAQEDFKTPKVMAMLFILPMWINFLLRTVATVELFNMCGLPLGEGALLFGLCYDYLPFMIYPIYNTLQKMDNSLVEAAQDLGASKWQSFWKVIVPLSMPGVYSGIVMVFMPTVSTFAIAELLTHNNIKLFGSLIQDYITTTDLLNYGAVLSLVLLIIIGLTSFFGDNGSEGEEKGGLV